MIRRRWLAAVGVAALTAAGAGLAFGAGRGDENAATETAAKSTSTALVTRRDLVEREDVDGSLGYADSRSATAQSAGRVTWLPTEGSIVRRGEPLYEVDGTPVPLFFGTRPAWRRFEAGMDDGLDVEALERNLAALGYDAGGALTVDEHFDFATRAALERWQRGRGLDATGKLDPGDVAFLPDARRVGSHKAEIAAQAQPGAALFETTSTRRIVTVDLDATAQDLARKGAAVRVTLPDGRTVDGRITAVGTVAETSSDEANPGEEADPTVKVTISVEERTGSLDQAPVDVSFERSRTKNALTVPVRALLALSGGGYAVEVVRAGTTHLLAVETGAFADGYVEVSGPGIREGVRVVTAE